jgi:hypothetical protein
MFRPTAPASLDLIDQLPSRVPRGLGDGIELIEQAAFGTARHIEQNCLQAAWWPRPHH